VDALDASGPIRSMKKSWKSAFQVPRQSKPPLAASANAPSTEGRPDPH
jgi:hypothetical protein